MEIYICEKCGAQFFRKIDLARHLEVVCFFTVTLISIVVVVVVVGVMVFSLRLGLM